MMKVDDLEMAKIICYYMMLRPGHVGQGAVWQSIARYDKVRTHSYAIALADCVKVDREGIDVTPLSPLDF